jgi:hypothetical protein
MKILILAALIWSGAVHADLITLKAGSVNKESVNISLGASVNLDGALYDVTTVGSGLRKKKVVLVPIKVYIAQLMLNDPNVFEKTDALASIGKQTSVVMHLTFLRDVPADNIRESFQSSLDANGVPASDPDIVTFMTMVNDVGAAESGSTLTIFTTKQSDGSETVALENKKGTVTVMKTMAGSAGLTHKLMSIWLGVPADDYLTELKAELLQ